MSQSSSSGCISIIGFLVTFFFFFLAFRGCQHQNIDLTKVEKLTSVIIDKGKEKHKTSRGGTFTYLYIELDNLYMPVGFSKNIQKYEKLLDKLNIGDTITVWFLYPRLSGFVNTDLIQIEKNGQILLPKKDYERKERSGIFFGWIFGPIALLITLGYIKLSSVPKSPENNAL